MIEVTNEVKNIAHGKICKQFNRYMYIRVWNSQLCALTCVNNLNVFALNMDVVRLEMDLSKSDFLTHLNALNKSIKPKHTGIQTFGSEQSGVNVRVIHRLLESKGFRIFKELNPGFNEWIPIEMISQLSIHCKYIVYVYLNNKKSKRTYEAHYLALDRGYLICDSTKKKGVLKLPLIANETNLLKMCDIRNKADLGLHVWRVEQGTGAAGIKRFNTARNLLIAAQPELAL